MMKLVIAALFFVASHMIFSWTPIRSRLTKVIGNWPFVVLYSLIALAGMAWMLMTYGSISKIDLWQPHMAFRHMAVSLMPIACFFIVAGYTSPNPTAFGFGRFQGLEKGPYGVFRITRHPILWGVALWALSHLMANGSDADVVLFSAMTFLSLAGAWHLDHRKSRELGEVWNTYCASTSSIPFIAIIDKRQQLSLSEIGAWRIVLGLVLYFAMLAVHQNLIGVSPLPMP